MESTPPGGEDPTAPVVTGGGFDQFDQIIFYVIIGILLFIIGRYSEQILAFGRQMYSRARGSEYAQLNDKLTMN